VSAIGGVFHFNGQPCESSTLDALAALLQHRASDGMTTWQEGPAGLVHGRSITTPESAREHQPLVDAAGRVAVTFDGRLDNRTELLRHLGIDAGDQAAIGDAELVLRLYRALGLECVARLLGDFAFAIWDGPVGRLLCARDHLGLKPLCYRRATDRIAWASEAGALARYDSHIPPPNEGMVAEHLSGLITSTRDTVFRDIFRLPAAHLLTADRSGVHVRRYWAPDLCREIRYRDPHEYVAELGDLMRRAVAARLRVAGPVAVSLSGGIDSSAVTGVAAELCRERAVPATRVEALSLADPDESAFWSQVVDRWQIASSTVPVTPLPAGQLAAEALFYLDVPNSPLAALTDRLRMRMRDGGTRVALTGAGADDWLGPAPYAYADLLRQRRLGALAHRLRHDAADEWFMGWPRAATATVWPLLPAPAQIVVRRVLRRGRPPAWIEPAFASRVDLRERLVPQTIDLPHDSWERYDIWRAGVSGSSVFINEAIERSSARVGVDMWHPFMDLRLVEFGLALPAEHRWRDGRAKDLLRRAMAPYLPAAVAERTTSPDATHLLMAALQPEGGRALFQGMTASGLGWVREEALLARFDRATALYRTGDRRYAALAISLWRVAAIELWARAVATESMVQ
jgi:asparagine synthase (glutamine-hydrolysing)